MKVKGNKKGFTLIELLAVIIILGILMIIAIPSVTRYIIQSRKNALINTIDNYITAMSQEVNNLNYEFFDSNVIYAVPVECLGVEKGGTSPFGEWHQANNSYWAYVLVQTGNAKLSYTYGFTFKDSSGYGLYPTASEKVDKNGSQLEQNLDLKKPKNGVVEKLTSVSNWNGFNVDSTTNLKVLRAEEVGIQGDGINTCTLHQKGENYEQVNYHIGDKNKPAKELPILMKHSSTKAFWQYKNKIKTIIFDDSINIPSNISNEHKWDVSSTSNGMVMAYITPNETDPSYYDLYIQGKDRLYANQDSSYLFADFVYLDSINNMDVLDTSKVTNMSYMFSNAGSSSTMFTLDLGERFDTSNVTTMNSMFSNTGYSSTVFTLNLRDKFDTSNVTDMRWLFNKTGNSSTIFTLDLGDKFDTSNVTSMYCMFAYAGQNSTVFTLDLGDKFDTSKVTNMYRMFCYVGSKNPSFKLDCSSWNVDKVTSHDSFNQGVTSKITAPTWK